jgi:NAD(P)-dependent dehydrogenase (short-subunit alcohol dehydrogenase family)
MQGKICLVTGANSGIGKAMADALAQKGAHVVMVCRNLTKGNQALSELRAKYPDSTIKLYQADVSSLASIREFSEKLTNDYKHLDVLINNAGVYLPSMQLNKDCCEMMMATNHLGAFMLSQLLFPLLKAAEHARLITVSSMAHLLGTINWNNLQCERSFIAMRQYGTTKLANILFTKEASKRWQKHGITANCFHPGAVGTNFAQSEPGFLNSLFGIGKVFLKTPEQGASTGVYLACSAEMAKVSGEYLANSKIKTPSRQARDPELANKLWEQSIQLVKLSANEVH